MSTKNEECTVCGEPVYSGLAIKTGVCIKCRNNYKQQSNAKQESIAWYKSHEKQIDTILKLTEGGSSPQEIGSKLRIAESAVFDILKNGKEKELEKILKFAHLTKEDISEEQNEKDILREARKALGM